tara:strand:+ start:1530 stop:2228 length:699 start_codon:yes stop_codon:yes gene_type:complete
MAHKMAELHFSIKENAMKAYLTLLSVFLLSSQANAAILNSWTDEATFLSANAGLSMESFEQTNSGNLPLVAGDITVSTDNVQFGTFNGTNTNSSFGVTDGNQNIVVGLNDGESIFFDFANGIDVFGINIWGFGTQNGNPLLTFFDNNGNSQSVLAGTVNTDEQAFFGVILDSLFTKVQFQYTGANGDGIYFDEAYYGTVNTSAVPIPAAAFLFAPALLGFMGLRRKAKNLTA